MALAPGARLGPYEITAEIGAGGMGTVYRAKDWNLGRDVAIKVLPDAFAQDPERLARFDREAKTLASLNHPNIATIHGLERTDGVRAIVMELVEGPTLADRIAQGPVSFDEALRIGRQIADALDAAHGQGIIHRDLKPANVKVRPDGTVKVLDFGLAKVLEPAGTMSPDATQSATMTSPAMMTGAGVLLGTAAYMSPEQSRGKAVDKRADIWAFGCVMYETLSGTRPFDGDSITDTLASIVTKEPSWRGVPIRARRLLERCLEKDPSRRLRDIGDAFLLLEEPSTIIKPRSRAPWVLAGAAVVLAALTAWAASRAKSIPPGPPTFSADIDLGAEIDSSTVGSSMILSPDGRRLIVVTRGPDGVRRLFRRNLNESRGELLPGTEGAILPFFAPDSQRLGFFAGGKLKKTQLEGGGVTELCDAPAGRGGAWSEDDTIVAALDTRAGLSTMPAGGGAVASFTQLNAARKEASHRWPRFVAGGHAVIFTASTDPAYWEFADIAVVSRSNTQVKILIAGGGADARYIASGHLVYQQAGTLFAVPFDRVALELGGTPRPVLEGIGHSANTGLGLIDISMTGHAVYQRGGGDSKTLHWLDETGSIELALPDPSAYHSVAISPDGSWIAFERAGELWVHDWRRGPKYRLSTDNPSNSPIWTDEGRKVIFRSKGGIYWVRADGGGKPHLLLQSANFLDPLAVSPNGKTLAYAENAGAGTEIMMVALETDGDNLRAQTPHRYVNVPSTSTRASFSHDGRWFAYATAKSSIYEVHVRAFPDTGSEWTVSTGGHMPVWSKNNRELFYRTEDGRLMVVAYTVKGDTFVHEKPRQWSKTRLAYTGLARNFDLAPDGKRFLVGLQVKGPELPNHVVLIANFFDEVRRLAGPGRN